MGATTLISVAEYLNTSYSPDREYIDGQIVERNLGEKTHSRIQRKLIIFIDRMAKDLGIEVFPEQRVQVSPTRFRIPDVTVVKTSQAQDEIFLLPPHLCIEILSKDDTMDYMQEKIDDYHRVTAGRPFDPAAYIGYLIPEPAITAGVMIAPTQSLAANTQSKVTASPPAQETHCILYK